MAGPWERYSAPQAPAESGPWSQFNQPAEETGRGGGFLPFLYRGAASILGAPVDIANAVLGMDPKYLPFGVGRAASAAGARPATVSEAPVGGSASIEALLAKYGRAIGEPMVPEVGQQAETGPEYIGRSVGETAGMLIPGYGAARALAPTSRSVMSRIGGQEAAVSIPAAPASLPSRIAGQVADAPVRAPLATLAGEMASGAGAGAGRYMAEQAYPGSEVAGTYGELAGGLTPSLAAMLAKYGPTGLMYRGARASLTPFTEAGAEVRAGRRLGSLVPEPDVAARAAEAPSISELTPAQRTQDVRLLALEKAVADKDPAMAKTLIDRAAAAQTTLIEEAAKLGGDPAQARAFFTARRDRLDNSLEAVVSQARNRAQERVATLDPGTSREDASRVVRQEFDKAYDAARRQEDNLWRSLPADVEIDTAPLFSRFDELVANTPRTQQQDIPDYARQFLQADKQGNRALRGMETPAELQGFRGELLAIERKARDAGDRNQARLARELADATLGTMNSLPDVSGPYAVARDFSRKINQTFREGPAGLLTDTTSGAPSIPAEMTLTRLIGPGGVKGGVAERSLMAATGDSAPTKEAVQDYLTRTLRDRVVTSEGRIKPEAATSWMRQNEALLNQYPDVRKYLDDALAAQKRADDLAKVQTVIGREALSPSESPMGRFLGGDPADAVARIFKAENPAEVAVSLRRSADRDTSGKALSGLRGAFVTDLLAQARTPTPEGEVFRGSVILDNLRNPQQRAAYEAVFKPDEMKRLDQIANEFMALERTRGPLPSVGGVVDDTPSKILDYLGRVAGARIGAAMGGNGMAGSLQAASMGSARARDWMRSLTGDRAEKLITRSITDPELFADLMRQTTNPRLQDQGIKKLQAWLAGPAGRELFDEESAQPQNPQSDVQNIYSFIMNPEAKLPDVQRLINSPAMRTRVEGIFESPARSDLFVSALNREAQLFHKANERGGQGSGIVNWDRSLTNLVAQAIRNGEIDDRYATRINGLLRSSDPREVAAAVRILEDLSRRQPQ